MGDVLNFTVLSFGSLFAIMSPFGTVPTFLAMTEDNSAEERLRMVKVASGAILAVLLVFAVIGPWIFSLFRVTVPALQIGGGIVLLRPAMDMLQGRRSALKETSAERAEGANKEDIAITPLAIPMLVGPGTITTVILLSQRASGFVQYLALVSIIGVIVLMTFWVLRAAALYASFMGAIAQRLIGRLMGLLLAVIAVQFLLNGVSTFISEHWPSVATGG